MLRRDDVSRNYFVLLKSMVADNERLIDLVFFQ